MAAKKKAAPTLPSNSDLIQTQRVADIIKARYSKARDLMSKGVFGEIEYNDRGKRCVSEARVRAWLADLAKVPA